MPITYVTPGVYVEEVPSGARPIQAVGTSTAGFIGKVPDPDAPMHQPIGISNWSQFVETFVTNGHASTPLSHAVYGFYLNGGGRCWIVNVGDGPIVGARREGLNVLEEIDEVAIVAAPGYTDPASYEALLAHCEKLKDRVAILGPPESVTDFNDLKKVGTAKKSGDESSSKGGLRPRQSDQGYGAFYFPQIVVSDPLDPQSQVAVDPVGHIAGIWARTDASRGVHKAPANEIVRGALDVTYRVTHEEQGELNPIGVNCIRFFTGEGIRVYGARTVAPGSSEWRYLNVRRLTTMIEESIEESTRWIVFESNDETLWKSIRRDVTAFLMRVWRDGGLMGASPQEAFFVQCDAETNPPEVIDAGIVVTVIGLAPVKPAEFIVFRIMQTAGEQIEV